MCHLTGRDCEEDEIEGREGGVFKSAALHLSGMEKLAPVISEAIVCHVSVELIASFGPFFCGLMNVSAAPP